MTNKIKLGLPKGSLNTIGRGNTYEILTSAGYDVQGYEPGKESDRNLAIVNDPDITAFLTRPQSAPVELSRGLLDIAIVGEDWVREECANGKDTVRKIGDLEYGKTRLVLAVPNNLDYVTLTDFFKAQRGRKTPILCFTEYPNLTRQRFMSNKGYKSLFGNQRPLVQVRGLVDGENQLVQIINSDGITEGYIRKGADIIADTAQSGLTLGEYELKELEMLMHSSAGLYAGPSCTGWKEEKAREIFKQLFGAVKGKEYFDLKFNVPNRKLKGARDYLVKEGLCADEPTVNRGKYFSSINILISRSRYPEASMTLNEKYQASAFVRNEIKQFVR